VTLFICVYCVVRANNTACGTNTYLGSVMTSTTHIVYLQTT